MKVNKIIIFTSGKSEETVHEHLEKVGVNAPVWTSALVQQFLEQTYDVEYSLLSCRRLLNESRLRYQKTYRSTADEGR